MPVVEALIPPDRSGDTTTQAVVWAETQGRSPGPDDRALIEDELIHPGITLRTLHFSGEDELHFRVSAQGVGVAYVHAGGFESAIEGVDTAPARPRQLRFFFNGPHGEVRAVKKPGTLKSTIVLVDPDYLLKLCPPDDVFLPDQLLSILQGDRTDIYFDAVPIASAMTMIAESVHDCDYRGAMRKLFLEAKALEFIALGFHALKSGAAGAAPVPRDGRDLQQLKEAKSILEKEYDDPPSISDLARRVGLNECKLKSGFRTHFKTTVFSIVLECRVNEAIRLLRDSDLGIAQIGYRVGYGSGTAFTRAFRRIVGCTPKAVRDNGLPQA